jgi:plasmid segregation protein ParM
MTDKNKGKNLMMAVDDGFAYVKVVRLDEKGDFVTSAIPSAAASGLTITHFSGEEQGGYETEGLQFTVNNVPKPLDTRNSGYPYSPMNRAIVHHAIRKSGGLPETSPVTVDIGLTIPMAQYYEVGKDRIVEKRKASFDKPVRAVGSDQELSLNVTNVYPEAASAWIDYLIDEKGNDVNSMDDNVVIIDVGGKTTDVAVINSGGRIEQSQSGTDDIGVMNLIEVIQSAINQKTGSIITAPFIEQCVRSPSEDGKYNIKMFGKPADVTEIVNSAKKRISEELIRSVQHRIGDAVTADVLLFVGGGAMILKDALKEYPHITVPKNPEFANARGVLKYMLYMQNK